jgi:hypothetical protein
METKTTKRQSVCFAYFADGKFLGWYADSFGSIRNSPKIYGNTENQKEIILKNFRHKLAELNKESTIGKHDSRLSVIDRSLNADKTDLMQYNDIELRVVECPEYDGPNPNYDAVKYKAWLEKERAEKLDKFKYANCPPELNNWLYADYSKVKEWASKEPTQFLETMK